MVYGLFLSALMSLIFISSISMQNQYAEKLKNKNGTFNTSISRFSDNRGLDRYSQTDFNQNDKQTDRETIETSLIRTCKAVSTLAHANGCSEWSKASYTWSFVGAIGGTGSLDSTETGTTVSTFACSDNAEFGRGLFQNSIPSSYVVGEGFYYDFTDMNDSNTDPCGYLNIVRF